MLPADQGMDPATVVLVAIVVVVTMVVVTMVELVTTGRAGAGGEASPRRNNQ